MQLSLLTSKAVRNANSQLYLKAPLVFTLEPRRSFHSQIHRPLPSSIPLWYRPTIQSRTRNLLRSNTSPSMQRRRQATNSSTTTTSTATQNGSASPKHNHTHHEHEHEHEHDHEGHSHSHGGIFHTHSHDHSAHDGQAEAVVKFMRGEGVDRGTKVTILGLLTNVGLTAVKGVAGWWFHSAALLAEAGHSLSDLLADFVTLVCWRLSRKPPTDNYPYGFGKYETFGTATVSILLIGAALAIGHHSYSTVLHVIEPTIQSMQAGAAQEILKTFVDYNMTALDAVKGILPHAHTHGAGHSHEHEAAGVVQSVDINAAWFALASVVTKEWIYRLTKKVADEEKSPVLDANAQHHRSDAYSSAVAFAAIVGTWAVPGLPLDALGGTLISILIFQQGWGLFKGAMRDLTDAGVPENTRGALRKIVDPLVTPPTSSSTSSYPNTQSILAIRNVRAIRSGSVMFVDLTADVSPLMTVREAHYVEDRIRKAIMSKRSEVREVRVHLHALEDGQFPKKTNGNGPC